MIVRRVRSNQIERVANSSSMLIVVRVILWRCCRRSSLSESGSSRSSSHSHACGVHWSAARRLVCDYFSSLAASASLSHLLSCLLLLFTRRFSGFPRITNVNKFGQKFVGKVANPEDLLLFSKQKAVSTKGR